LIDLSHNRDNGLGHNSDYLDWIWSREFIDQLRNY
jgi:hypothetical protein